jgi:uncharacterized protein YecT (DUF1311 family)
MSPIKYRLLLVLPLLAPLMLVHAGGTDEAAEAKRLRSECVAGGNQRELNACATADFYESDLEMNELYKTQFDRLRGPAKLRLRDSQRAWIKFRDAACLYEAGLATESGSMWQMDQNLCMTTHTKQRTEDLKSYVACTENGCPE